MPGIKERLEEVRGRIGNAARRAGRNPEEITLVAVSKRVDASRIGEALQAGVRDFGENYYQEAREKIPLFGEEVRWHFIGALQTNKAKYVVGNFALIHSVDTVHLAEEISRRALAKGIVQPVLAEVKLDVIETKHGISEEGLMELVESARGMEGLELLGLMGMPPLTAEPEEVRPYFRKLKGMFDLLPEENRKTLSMGMSADFEIAIEEGATLVRVGSAIFGARI